MLYELFIDTLVEAIKRITIPIRPKQDSLSWVEDTKGLLSVKFAYRVIQGHWSTSTSASSIATGVNN